MFHAKLPWLVLCVRYICNCFDSQWVCKQWCDKDRMWGEEYSEGVIGPIVGHANDGDSKRR